MYFIVVHQKSQKYIVMVKIVKSIKKVKGLSLISKVLNIEQFGWDSSFYKRQPKKITASALFESFWRMHQKGKNTLSNWCTHLQSLIGQPVSEQSLNERLTETTVDLAKKVLTQALNLKIDEEKIQKEQAAFGEKLGLFNRILIRDSTTQQLPSHLKDAFPGSHSHGNATAIVRIQALFDFTAAKWLDFDISAYTDNDQKAANCIESQLQPNDLILQDLGYFTLDWLEQLTEKQYVITHWKPGTHLFNEMGEKLDLVDLLKNNKETDMPVLVGAKKKLPMRLVARKLPKKKAQKRIKAAKKDRHSNSNHSEEYYELLKYEIYLTNIDQQFLDGKNIAKLYGLRWHIEILFKSWKSYANFKTLFEKGKMNLARTKFTIYAVLIELVYLKNVVFNFFQNHPQFAKNTFLSCLKFMDVVNDLFETIISIQSLKDLQHLLALFRAKATYKKHSKRQNTMQKYLYVNELCIIQN